MLRCWYERKKQDYIYAHIAGGSYFFEAAPRAFQTIELSWLMHTYAGCYVADSGLYSAHETRAGLDMQWGVAFTANLYGLLCS